MGNLQEVFKPFFSPVSLKLIEEIDSTLPSPSCLQSIDSGSVAAGYFAG